MEQWKDICGYEGICQVSSLGRIRSLERVDSAGHRLKGRLRRHGLDKNGYHIIGLCKDGKMKTFKVHRLVVGAFSDKPISGLEVNHIDGDKGNNCIDNLELVSCIENHHHAKKLGLKSRGSAHFRSSLTEESATAAWEMLKEGRPLSAVAKHLNVSTSCINHLKQGRVWSWLLHQHN